MKKWFFNLFLIVPTLLLLIVLEAGFRIHAYYSDARLQRGLAEVGQGPLADDLSLQHIIRWHDNPKIIYELIGGLRGEFRGHRLTINDQGFRGPRIPPEKPPNTYRIVGIGDSVMFGWGVADDEFYLAKLGDILSESIPQVRIEWLNSAVPGYNTVSEVATLKEKLLVYEPDLVLVDYVQNDLYIPGFISRPRPYFTLDYSYLARFVRHNLDGLHVPDNTLQRPPDAFRHENFDEDEELIPEQYRELIGIDAYREAMIELKQLSETYGFNVLVLAHHGFDVEISEVLADIGIETLDTKPLINDFLNDKGFNQYTESPLVVSEKDSHPSALLHRMLAEYLALRIGHTIEKKSRER